MFCLNQTRLCVDSFGFNLKTCSYIAVPCVPTVKRVLLLLFIYKRQTEIFNDYSSSIAHEYRSRSYYTVTQNIKLRR